jgi:hypothetical protein
MHPIPCVLRSPTRNRARVAFYRGERDRAEQIARRLFGRRLGLSEYAGLTGASDRDVVDVGTLAEDLYLEIHGPPALPCRVVVVLRSTPDGPVIVNESFHILLRSCQNGGLGLSVFSRQVDGARRLGVNRIETVAGRRDYENGYYTWPRFGFDGRLAAAIRQLLPPRLDGADTVLDLMASAPGRRWWKRYGVPLRVAFDLSDRSRSWSVLRRYQSRRWGRAKIDAGGQTFLSAPGKAGKNACPQVR